MVFVLLIDPVEALMLRGKGEFSPTVIGTRNYAISLLIPRPSTVAGMLGTFFYDESNQRNNWLDILIDLFQGKIDKIYGLIPVIKEENKYQLLYPLRYDEDIALFKSKKEICDLIDVIKKGEHDKWEAKLFSAIKANNIIKYISISERLGIALDREKKVTKEHYIYLARYVFPKYKIGVIIKNWIDEEKLVAQLGGEGRVVSILKDDSLKISVAEEGENVNLIDCVNKEASYYSVLTPLVINEDCVEESKDHMVIGKIDKITMGFDIRFKRRKELVTAILEGSVIEKELLDRCEVNGRYSVIGYNAVTCLCL
ncbi:type III-B CRISPR module-associated protein Cmr3 [Sulfurisphaera javensis]|uniref:Type III-B CRISPR module-associated protein Cmr3 n=1 Tax=Sulfurisphaera javensis TaxID=2049879 RepID=A0AAT9GV30_9CREN